MPTRCPTCGHLVTPVYCAASTPERPLMLAWSVAQAAERLGISGGALREHLTRWGDGWRLVRQHCCWCGAGIAPRQRYSHEYNCLSNPKRRAA